MKKLIVLAYDDVETYTKDCNLIANTIIANLKKEGIWPNEENTRYPYISFTFETNDSESDFDLAKRFRETQVGSQLHYIGWTVIHDETLYDDGELHRMELAVFREKLLGIIEEQNNAADMDLESAKVVVADNNRVMHDQELLRKVTELFAEIFWDKIANTDILEDTADETIVITLETHKEDNA